MLFRSGGIDRKPTLDFMKAENSYTADMALRQDVMILRTLNNIINAYRAEQDQFPGIEEGNPPKEGSPISYITYRTLVDQMYLEEKNINFATKDLKWESKLVDERVKIVYDEVLDQCCIQIPGDNKELMAIYEQLSEGYKKIIKRQ